MKKKPRQLQIFFYQKQHYCRSCQICPVFLIILAVVFKIILFLGSLCLRRVQRCFVFLIDFRVSVSAPFELFCQ